MAQLIRGDIAIPILIVELENFDVVINLPHILVLLGIRVDRKEFF